MTGKAISPIAEIGREVPDQHQLVWAAKEYAEADMALGTRRAYGSSLRSFTSWCASVGIEKPIPAEAAHVALYLTALAPTRSVSTLARHLAAIAAFHRQAGLAPPASPALNRIWAGIRRTHGRPPRKKRALVIEDLRRVLAKLPATSAGTRDRALLLVGFAGALRRSELAILSVEGEDAGDVYCRFVSGGLEVHILRSKGDQLGEGAVLAIPYGRKDCPVSALQAWIKAAEIRSGPIFRAVDRHGRLGDVAMSEQAVADVVKRSVARAGFDPTLFAGHSLRSGLITSAARAGATPYRLQRHARHARGDTTLGYIQDAESFDQGNVAGKVRL